MDFEPGAARGRGVGQSRSASFLKLEGEVEQLRKQLSSARTVNEQLEQDTMEDSVTMPSSITNMVENIRLKASQDVQRMWKEDTSTASAVSLPPPPQSNPAQRGGSMNVPMGQTAGNANFSDTIWQDVTHQWTVVTVLVTQRVGLAAQGA